MSEALKLPGVSIIVVNFNGREYLEKCFSSLDKLDYPKEKTELIMVDNSSTDGSVEFMQKNFPNVIILKNDANNYCISNNLGIKKSSGEFIALLNNDTRVDKNWLKELINAITSNDRIGAAGSRILFEDGKLQSAGHVEFPYYYYGDRGFLEEDVRKYDTMQEVRSVSNCSALYRKSALDEVGLLDEDFVMYMEDVDLCFRLVKNKWKVLYVPDSRVYHKMHGSIKYWKERTFNIEKNRLLFIVKHFPEKLSANIAGYGNISSLEPKFLHLLLLEILNKLIEYHGSKKATKVFTELTDEIKKISDYSQHVWRETEKNTQIKDEELSAKTKEVHTLNDEIDRLKNNLIRNEKDAQSLKEILEGKNQELDDFKKLQEDLIKRLDTEISNRDTRIKQQEELIGKKDTELKDAASKLKAQEDKTRLLEKEAGRKKELLDKKDAEILSLKNRIELEINNLKAKEGEVQRLRSEIHNIYNSETYRLIVRPMVWPFFSFVKKTIKPFKVLFDKVAREKEKGVCIAQMSAKGIEAKYRQKNEYFIKVINNKFRDERIKLVVDIWPFHNRYHPDRHYAYFVKDILIPSKTSISIKVFYDWEKSVEIFANDNAESITDLWRGRMLDYGLYSIDCIIYNLSHKQIDSLNIMQRLTK